MPKYKTLRELQTAYQRGKLTESLMLDNDTTSVYVQTGPDEDDYEAAFEMHPDDLLGQALDLLGIPHEHV